MVTKLEFNKIVSDASGGRGDPKRSLQLFPYIELDHQAHLREDKARAESNYHEMTAWRKFSERLHELVDEIVIPRIEYGDVEEIIKHGGVADA